MKNVIDQLAAAIPPRGQAELARRLGITQGGLNHYLTGRREMPLAFMTKIAEAVGFELRIRLVRKRS